MKKSIKDITVEDLCTVLPYEHVLKVLEFLCGKREVKQLEDYMNGQTMAALGDQSGIYITDLIRLLNNRKADLKAKDMPLFD